MLRGLRLLQCVSWKKPSSHIEWQDYGNFVDLKITFKDKKLVCLVGANTTFTDMGSMQCFKNFQFKYPKDFDPEIGLQQFLNISDEPLCVEMRREDEVFYLNNRAREPITPVLLRAFDNKRGLFHLLNKQMDIGQKRSVLTQAYLKLEAEAFCRNKGYPHKSQLTPTIRQDILNYLCFKNQSNEQETISLLEKDKQQKYQFIAQYQQSIKEIESNADRVLRIYQWGAIAATTLHLVGFGYMIFFVDWLGWDIIEPVTFSVSCLYLLLALRFYRKFRRDRNEQTIRQRFRELVLTPKNLMKLKTSHYNLNQHKESLKETELQLILCRNRIAQSSTLNNALLQQ